MNRQKFTEVRKERRRQKAVERRKVNSDLILMNNLSKMPIAAIRLLPQSRKDWLRDLARKIRVYLEKDSWEALTEKPKRARRKAA